MLELKYSVKLASAIPALVTTPRSWDHPGPCGLSQSNSDCKFLIDERSTEVAIKGAEGKFHGDSTTSNM